MNVRRRCLSGALALTIFPVACAQTVAANPTAITEKDKGFAATLAMMPLQEAKAAIAKAALEHEPGARLTEGNALALQALGNVAIMDVKHPEPALPLFLMALDVAQRVGADKLAARVMFGVANAYRFSGDNDNALLSYTKAEKMALAAKGEPLDFAKIHSARAVIRMDVGDLDGSMEDGNTALREYTALGDQSGMARVLNNLGNTELSRANFSAARQEFEEGLKLARKSHQRLGEAFLLNNISTTYLQQENWLLATEYCIQSLKIKEEMGDQESVGSSLVNLARIYLFSGRTAEAMQTAERASAVAKELGLAKQQSLALVIQGAVAQHMKRLSAALSMYRKAYELSVNGGDRLHANEVLVEIAEVEFEDGQYAESLRDASAALEQARALHFPKNVQTAAETVGQVQLKRGKLAEAQAALEEGLAAVEQMRQAAAGGDQAAAEFFARQVKMYRSLAEVDARQQLWDRAFLTSESEKGRALLDVLTHGRPAARTDLTAKEKNELSTLKARVSALMRARTEASMEVRTDAFVVAGMDRKLRAAHDALTLFGERMSVAHPEMKRRRGEAELITLQQAGELLTASTAVLEYEVTEDATLLFVLTKGAGGTVLRGYSIAVEEAALSRKVGAFHTALMSRDPGFGTAARNLYQLLVGPAARQIAGKTRLIVVPSGELWHLPFQALQDGGGKYLAERFAISNAPSLSVLRAYKAKGAGTRAASLVAFGDPGEDLPEAAHEVEAVAEVFGRERAKTFLRSSATLANYRTSAVKGEEILLATHGVYNDQHPMDSYLLLASDGAGGKTVQMDAGQIGEMKLKAKLVVLSACDTAEGKYQAGEGLVGLGWSFLAAGSQSAVASQWRVESSSTTELMIAFHRGMREGLSASAALRRAEVSLAHGERYKHPFYWAGFVLLGND